MRSADFCKALAGLLMALVLAAPARAGDGVMSLRDFRAAIEAQLHKRLPKARIVEKGDDTLLVFAKPGDKDPEDLFLGNVYARYRNNPDAADLIIGNFVDSMAMNAGGKAPKVSADQFVILVRPDGYLNDPRLKDTRFLVWRPLAGHLIQVMAIDQGPSFRMATIDDVKSTFGSADKAWAPALANSDTRKGDIRADPAIDGLWSVTSSNDLADTLMLVPDPWAGIGIVLKGRAVVVAYQRNALLVADSANPTAVATLRAFLKDTSDDGETLSTEMFIRRGGAWVVYAGDEV